MKPTIEEVKEYFKDAETIECIGNKLMYNLSRFPNLYLGKNGFEDGGYYFSKDKKPKNNCDYVLCWSKHDGYAKILTYKKPKFRPIAMKCNQEQFDAVKGKLGHLVKYNYLDDFNKCPWLLNNYAGKENEVANNQNHNADDNNRKVHETWNEKVFLQSCGIVVEDDFTLNTERRNEVYINSIKYMPEPKEENFVISKNKIIQISKMSTHRDLVMREVFPSAFVEDKKELGLEVGKWYNIQTKTTKYLLLYSDNKNELYAGFMNGNWGDDWCCSKDCNQKLAALATQEEVKEALTKEAVKRRLIPENIKIIKCLYDYGWKEDDRNTDELGVFEYEKHFDKLWIMRGTYLDTCVYSKGQWAEIVKPKQMTRSDIEKELGYKIEILK